jgi:hypothetical protein
MASAAPKKRPMRSHKAGLKKKKLVDSNLAILKKLTIFTLIIGLFGSCVVVKKSHHGFKHHHHHYYRP